MPCGDSRDCRVVLRLPVLSILSATGSWVAVARRDYLIPANTVRKVELEGPWKDNVDWILEKFVVSGADRPIFAVPNVLINGAKPFAPVANTTPHPRLLRKGEILGEVKKAEDCLDIARNTEHEKQMESYALAVSTIIASRMTTEPSKPAGEDMHEVTTQREEPGARGSLDPEGGSGEEKPGVRGSLDPEENFVEEEQFGPKLAEIPEDESSPPQTLEEVLDVGDLPDDLKEEAWDMLKRREGAFGFNGRLGHHPTRVKIRTAPDQTPIAAPMYGASPAKRAVIDEQVKKWFEQGVIEPSVSPWSAPVVIVYRNGKPRFCVDYRKLNAVTIPDEFPIPRQSEILGSLAGAQVLSSLDALSGFTQLEVDPADVEKTTFRTHLGLYQFKRMPFGLRNGPSIFQRVMQEILAPYLWLFCLVYIDDIIVYSRSYKEHISHLDKVLHAIERSGLTLSPTKCHLFYSSVILLGHKVSKFHV